MSFVKKGKKAREELYLPSLRYIAMDNWVEVLGHDAFIAWLKLHTFVDRQDENRENDRIPYSLEKVWTKLGMGKKKFYQKVLRPLWEYGLVDVVDYERSKRKSQPPKNIIVYTSPANRHETEIKPLKKLRDWDTEYESAARYFGKKGGRPTKRNNEEREEIPSNELPEPSDTDILGQNDASIELDNQQIFDIYNLWNQTERFYQHAELTPEDIKRLKEAAIEGIQKQAKEQDYPALLNHIAVGNYIMEYLYRVGNDYPEPFKKGPIPLLIAAMRENWNIPKRANDSEETPTNLDFSSYNWVNDLMGTK